ncbi:hypothetical protein [Martelella endophytica]|uniref:Uncharacterized protein n=1 Tax=Martelella endophytica TaxID=1486262 RepID=A0A0D5LKI4_MAREN|nr:hypothetical protein [Martelella endophytica]AJY44661.1 hypothetical protein TM49_01530 [Martelella endophytica]
MAYVPDNIIDALRGSHQLAVFVRLDTDPPLRLWLGVNDVPVGFDALDEAGAVYEGAGRLLELDTLEVLVNGTAGSASFTITGVDPDERARIVESLPPVRGCLMHVGMTTLDDYYQPMSAVIPLWQAMASHTTEAYDGGGQGDPATLRLSLTAVSGGRARSRPARTFWSAPHQKALSPTDLFCDQTGRLSRGVDVVWPYYS